MDNIQTFSNYCIVHMYMHNCNSLGYHLSTEERSTRLGDWDSTQLSPYTLYPHCHVFTLFLPSYTFVSKKQIENKNEK